MNFIDIIILILATLGAIRGYMCGMMAGLGGIAGILFGIIACHLFGEEAYSLLANHFDVDSMPGTPYSGHILAYILLFIPIYAISAIIGHLMKSILSAVKLGGIDKLGGGILGFLKYSLGMSIVLNIVYLLAPSSDVFRQSTLADGAVFKFIMDLAPYLWGLDILPDLS